MKSRNYLFVISLGLLLQSANIFAANSLSTKIHNQYQSLRALGMGNAFTAVADDYSLIFYNPAGFAKKKTNEIQFTLAGGGSSNGTLDIYDELKKAGDQGTSDAEKAANVSAVLEKYYGDTLGGRLQAAELFWIRKNWGVALIPVDLTLDLTIDKQAGPTIDLKAIKDTTVAFGFGSEINNQISWGVTAKAIHRLEVDERLIAIELATEPDLVDVDRAKEGLLIDADLGLLYTPSWFTRKVKKMVTVSKRVKKPTRQIAQEVLIDSKDAENKDKSGLTVTDVDPLKAVDEQAKTEAPIENKSQDKKPIEVKPNEERPEEEYEVVKEIKMKEVEENVYPLTFAAVARNVLGGKFSKQKSLNKKALEAPEDLPLVFDLGSQYEFAKWGGLTLRSMIDFKNLNHPEITTEKSLHAGLEFDYSPSGWFKTQFRAGLNQGYYTAGATLLLGVINIEAATYAEEVGTIKNRLENRVVAGKLGFNF